MAISADSQICGRLGEDQRQSAVLIEAQNIFIEKRSRFLKSDKDHDNHSSGGLPEPGHTQVFLDYIAVNNDNLEFFRAWETVIQGGKDHYYMTIDPGLDPASTGSGHTILFKDKSALDGYAWPPAVMSGILSELHTVDSITVLNVKNRQIVIDPVRHIKTLYIFGAGSVSNPTARIAAMTGFRVVVIDDTSQYANITNFPDVHEICVIDDFQTVMSKLKIDEDSFYRYHHARSSA